MYGAGRSRVTHPFATLARRLLVSFDLHVLGTPPAFILSQNRSNLVGERLPGMTGGRRRSGHGA